MCAIPLGEIPLWRKDGNAIHGPRKENINDKASLIAATAKTDNMTLVTRNVSDMEYMGVTLLNPWETETGKPL